MATEGTGAVHARDLGVGWKISPSIVIGPGETVELASVEGPGIIQHIWMTITGHWRHSVLRVYWDGYSSPSVECPVGDFFACGWGTYAQISSLAVCVNPGSGFNSYWQMPFRQHCRVTLQNLSHEAVTLYYQITYALLKVIPDPAAYFHAQFRRTNPVPYGEVYAILDGVQGQGQYVGTYLAWGSNSNGWWGEGEFKFYLNGDEEFPTICGTGVEDYFGGSYNFEHDGAYREFTTPYSGLAQVIRPDGLYRS